MTHIVLKAFSWCPDGSGVTKEDVVPGDERNFGAMADSLLAEGYIEPAKPKAASKQKPAEAE